MAEPRHVYAVTYLYRRPDGALAPASQEVAVPTGAADPRAALLAALQQGRPEPIVTVVNSCWLRVQQEA